MLCSNTSSHTGGWELHTSICLFGFGAAWDDFQITFYYSNSVSDIALADVDVNACPAIISDCASKVVNTVVHRSFMFTVMSLSHSASSPLPFSA